MTEDPRADLVARQYRRWQYPEPIEDLEATEAWDFFDPSQAHRVFWPDRPYQPEMDILVAGCGTNQAPTLALRNPRARVVGIDISQESLDHGRYLRHKHGLDNLDLRLLPIEEVGALDRDFDLIVCGGVLHHMASAQAGLDALAQMLRPDGVAAIMLYARYGRVGVEMMQSVFRRLGLRQDEESLRLVRAGLDWVDADHPVRTYLGNAPDLSYDTGMVDTFLHGRDVSFDVPGCVDLVEAAGLVFQGWLLNKKYYPPTLVHPGDAFLAAIGALPEREQWAVMEQVYHFNACHLFMACRPERPEGSYRIDFAGAGARDYVPSWRLQTRLDGETLVRHDGWAITLADTVLAMAQAVDGRRSVREIAARASATQGADAGGLERTAVELFAQLWKLDFVCVDLSAAVTPR